MQTGFVFPNTAATIPGSSRIGSFLGGKDTNVTLQGRLNFADKEFQIVANLPPSQTTSSIFGMGQLGTKANVTVTRFGVRFILGKAALRTGLDVQANVLAAGFKAGLLIV